MKYTCTIELPDNAGPIAFLDAIAQAGRDESKWKRIHSLPERMARTDLTNKCGSCKHFCLWHDSDVNGCCKAGHPWGQRTRPACKDYERKEE